MQQPLFEIIKFSGFSQTLLQKHCVWLPSAYPSACDLVMLLLKSVSWIFVGFLALTPDPVYIFFEARKSNFFFLKKVQPIKNLLKHLYIQENIFTNFCGSSTMQCKLYVIFVNFLAPAPYFIQFLGMGRVLTEWTPPPFFRFTPSHPLSSFFKFLLGLFFSVLLKI